MKLNARLVWSMRLYILVKSHNEIKYYLVIEILYASPQKR